MKKVIIFTFVLINSIAVYPQNKEIPLEEQKYFSLGMYDGNNTKGMLKSADVDSYFITSEPLGDITLAQSQVQSAQSMVEISKGKAWFPNPHETRYLFMPSAFTLKKGEAYYQNTYLFINSVNYGVTDRFTIGGGLNILGLFPTILSGQYILMPKYAAPFSENLHIGGGALLGLATEPRFPSEGIDAYFGGLLYTMGTLGNKENNLTLGIGYGFAEGEISQSPVFNFSGMTRISKKISLVTENWWISGGENTLVVSYALRIFGEKMSVNLGFLNNEFIFRALPIGIPWIDFAVKF